MLRMAFAEALRDESVDGLAGHLLRRTTEHLFSRRVEEDNALGFVNGDDRVHSRADDPGQLRLALTQCRFGPLAVGDVAHDGQELVAFGLSDARLEPERLAVNGQRVLND